MLMLSRSFLLISLINNYLAETSELLYVTFSAYIEQVIPVSKPAL